MYISLQKNYILEFVPLYSVQGECLNKKYHNNSYDMSHKKPSCATKFQGCEYGEFCFVYQILHTSPRYGQYYGEMHTIYER